MIPRILFVDDDENLLASYRRQFHRIFKVETASSGEEALERLVDDDPFWIVVSDYHMPGIDGLTFLRRARQVLPNAVLIVITGRADLETAIRAVNEGFVFQFLTKPVSGDDLLPILKEAARRHNLNKLVSAELAKAEKGGMMVSMCSHCRKVRQPEANPLDKANWHELELFLGQRFGIEFSHGLCPECVEELYGTILHAPSNGENGD